MFSVSASAQSYNDATLARVSAQDKSSRDDQGAIPLLTMPEHLYRADVYMANRHFPQAREHWKKIMDNFSDNDAAMAKALFGTARSYMWERENQKAVEWFDKLTKTYLNTKEGREGLAFKGASYIRLGKNIEAAKTYEQYTTMFPTVAYRNFLFEDYRRVSRSEKIRRCQSLGEQSEGEIRQFFRDDQRPAIASQNGNSPAELERGDRGGG